MGRRKRIRDCLSTRIVGILRAGAVTRMVAVSRIEIGIGFGKDGGLATSCRAQPDGSPSQRVRWEEALMMDRGYC